MLLSTLLQVAFVSSNVWRIPRESHSNQVLLRSAEVSSAEKLWFEQPISHKADAGTYKQKYYVNTEFYKPGGPAFLYLGGESPLGDYAVNQGIVTEMAKAHGGIVYGLEHRFYGESQPFADFSVESLRYLSTENGIEDARNFMQKVINPVTNKTLTRTKWITVGGSYPGSLSAWLRLKYPRLVYAALASSAPVHAKDDFFEYDQVVQKALGGACFKKIEQIKDYMDLKYENKTELNDLKSKLGCSGIENDIHFLSTVADMLATIVQYNTAASQPNVSGMCEQYNTITNIEELVNAHIENMKLFLTNWGTNCYDFSGLTSLKNTQVDTAGMTRQWFYQSCTEYGYWQTAPKGASTRSKYLTVDWFNDFFCGVQFYGKKIGPPNPKAMNSKYLARDNWTTRTIWTNGGSDPWIALSVSDTRMSSPLRPIYVIDNGSHGEDLGADRPTDSKSLTNTRKKILKDMAFWLKYF